MKELEPVQGRETKMNTGRKQKIRPVSKDRMDLGCLPCRAGSGRGRGHQGLSSNVLGQWTDFIMSLDRAGFMSFIVYLTDNSAWRKYQEGSVKSTGPGIWLPEFKFQYL